jgi:hypothetical protein
MMTSLPLIAGLAGLVLALSACQPDQKAPAAEKESPSTPAGPEKGTPPAKPDDPADAASYVGMTLEAAKARAEKAGIPSRVVEENGQSNPVTMDHRPERLNFAVKDGKIIRVTKG